MNCVDCDSTLGVAHPSAAVAITPNGSAGICGVCVRKYGPGVALDLRLDEAINTAAHDASPLTKRERRIG